MDSEYKEVYFGTYCKTCMNEFLEETDDACDECLATPVNLNSHKPINWKEKEVGSTENKK